MLIESLKEDLIPIDTSTLSCPIGELDLSVHLTKYLKWKNIHYIGDLIQRTEDELLNTLNFGLKSLDEIKEVLGLLGLKLGTNVEGWVRPT